MKLLKVLKMDGQAVTFNVDKISAITSGDDGKNVTVYTVGRDEGWQLLPMYTHEEIQRLLSVNKFSM